MTGLASDVSWIVLLPHPSTDCGLWCCCCCCWGFSWNMLNPCGVVAAAGCCGELSTAAVDTGVMVCTAGCCGAWWAKKLIPVGLVLVTGECNCCCWRCWCCCCCACWRALWPASCCTIVAVVAIEIGVGDCCDMMCCCDAASCCCWCWCWWMAWVVWSCCCCCCNAAAPGEDTIVVVPGVPIGEMIILLLPSTSWWWSTTIIFVESIIFILNCGQSKSKIQINRKDKVWYHKKRNSNYNEHFWTNELKKRHCIPTKKHVFDALIWTHKFSQHFRTACTILPWRLNNRKSETDHKIIQPQMAQIRHKYTDHHPLAELTERKEKRKINEPLGRLQISFRKLANGLPTFR